MPTLATFRARVSQIAAAAVGLGVNSRLAVVRSWPDGGDFETQASGAGAPGDGYSLLISDGETARAARDMAKMSGCALTVRGIWRLAGLTDPRLLPPYEVGMAPRDILEMAHEAEAIAPPFSILEDGAPPHAGGAAPKEGDALYFHGPAGEHFATFMAETSDVATGVVSWITVDGGERDAWHGETIQRKTRRLHHDAGKGWMLDDLLVVGVVDVDKLAAHFWGAGGVRNDGDANDSPPVPTTDTEPAAPPSSAEPAQAIPDEPANTDVSEGEGEPQGEVGS